MKNYRVSFFKIPSKDSDDEEQLLGTIVIDDCGVNQSFTLTAKAFRVASPNVLIANKVIVEQV